MESVEELERELKQLRIKKETVNAHVDLTRECNSIIELDNRLGSLLGQVRGLVRSTGEQNSFIGTVCDKLEPNYSALDRSCKEFYLCSTLQRLNRLCKQINTNPIFVQLLEASNRHKTVESCASEIRASLEEPPANADNTWSTGMAADSLVKEFVGEFEASYEPLECLLSGRSDLPYARCALKLRRLKMSLAKGNEE